MANDGRQLAPVDEFRGNLTRMEPQFQMALPKHISTEKFIRTVLTAVQQNPKLLNCNRASLYSACMKAATDGLLIDGREAALTTFKDVVAYMPMTAGILKKIRNSGELQSITSNIVFERDVFEYHVDADGEHVRHVPKLFGDRGSRIGAYALAKTKDGGVFIEVMTEEQLQAVRKVSRAANDGPWSGEFADEMRRKTVIRRLSKRLPMSSDIIGSVVDSDDVLTFEAEAQQPRQEVTPEPKKSRLEQIVDEAVPTKQDIPI